jgi:uncharacterized protein YjdB
MIMSSNTQKLRLIGAFAALATLALAASCRGFFVKPTLTTLAVAPASPSIQTGSTNNTVQMSAVGTFNDGSTGNPSVSWSISPANSVASINATGLVTSIATGSATVTATSNDNPTISGTQSLTVTVGCITSITLSPTSATISVSQTNHTASFTATANTCNGPFPITDTATWNTSSSDVATVAGGVVTAVGQGTVNISASSGGVNSPNALVTVTQ